MFIITGINYSSTLVFCGILIIILSSDAFFSGSTLQPVISLISSRNKLYSQLILDDSSDESGEDVFGGSVGPLPSVSSRVNYPKESFDQLKYDLWIVGAGVLGEEIIKQWKTKFPMSTIVAETKSSLKHQSLSQLGCIPSLREDRNSSNTVGCARNVIIALPPSACKGSTEHIEELTEACRLWAGPKSGGGLLFTSSIGVYGESLGNIVDENFRLDSSSSRTTNMVVAEESILLRDGKIMRLAGLYNSNRGPHTYWLKSQSPTPIDGSSDGLINMIHYEDAASACIQALANFHNNDMKVYLACDDKPVTRKEICESALASGIFPEHRMPTFKSEFGPRGKVCNGALTRKALNWAPRYTSFTSYMRCTIGGAALDSDSIADKVQEAVDTPKKASSLGGGLWLPGDDDDEIVDFAL